MSVHPNGYVVAAVSGVLFFSFIALLLWRSRRLYSELTHEEDS